MAQSDTTSRRAILGAGVAALIGAIAGAFGRPIRVDAADGDALIGGAVSHTSSPTVLERTGKDDYSFSVYSDTASAIYGHSKGAGNTGVNAYSQSGSALFGLSVAGIGMEALSENDRGVVGRTNGVDVIGVAGEARDRSSTGVVGSNASIGTEGRLGTPEAGVVGNAPSVPGLYGVLAMGTDDAVALGVDGKARFSRSGRAYVPRNRSSVDVVAPGGLDAESLVLAVPMVSRAGVFVQAVVPNPRTGTFRIQLNKVASSTAATPIGWFVVN
jgi:hypothetical protein